MEKCIPRTIHTAQKYEHRCQRMLIYFDILRLAIEQILDAGMIQ